MARGYPDYFGQSIWPKYGTMFQDFSGAVTVAKDATETINTITGQGSILCGYVYLLGKAYFPVGIVKLTIDDTEITSLNINSVEPNVFNRDYPYPLWFHYADLLSLECSLGVREGVSWRSSIVVTVKNSTGVVGEDLTVQSRLFYFHVT